MSKGLFGKESEVSAKDVVDTFTTFFVDNDHHLIEGSSIVPDNDPTLLFINSGMAPMKDYFLGIGQPPSLRMTNVQGCIRTKDIEEVGDRHHLTFFEMLGSWSIGDYWKEDAIHFAFELLTNGFGFPVDRLWASYYSGDEEKGIPADNESKEFWEKAGMHADKIVPFGADNFWGPAGKFGPCGPCTEVYFDTGAEFGPDFVPGGDFDASDRYIEIWNAGVFMQYDLQPSGFEPLKIKSVDTGSGLERMVMVLNGMSSCYDIDTMRPIRDAALSILGKNPPTGLPEMLSDHVRASVYILSEGVSPSNTGRGYIPRRLIRRCLAALAQITDSNDFSLELIVDAVFDQVPSWNSISKDDRDSVWAMFSEEQDAFKRVLRRGLKKLENAIPDGEKHPILSGEDAFNLVATYGLPIDTIRDFLQSKGGKVDQDAFEAAFDAHREVSRQGGGESSIADYLGDCPRTNFEGLEDREGQGEVLVLLQDGELVSEITKGEVEIVCDRSVFYPQGGGQIGDKGRITIGSSEVHISNTKKTATGHIVHIGRVMSGGLKKGDVVRFQVDECSRVNNTIHHSATHLLNAALRATLGDHVGQKGSLVEGDRLRFDFTHKGSVTLDEQEKIQELVNEYINRGDERIAEVVPYKEAIAAGATAMFSDKYGAEVRVVSFGDYSKELCGGTHVKNSKDIGLFLLVAEGSSSKGVRRISGVAGPAADQMLNMKIKVLSEVKKQLDEASNLGGKAEKLVNRLKDMIKVLDFVEIEKAMSSGNTTSFLKALTSVFGKLSSELNAKPEAIVSTLAARIAKGSKEKSSSAEIDKDALKASAKKLDNGVAFVVAKVEADVPTMREKAMEIAEEIEGIVCFMTGDEKPKIVIALKKSMSNSIKAGDIMKVVGPLIGAKGGGKPHLVAGGGTKADGVKALIEGFGDLVGPLLV